MEGHTYRYPIFEPLPDINISNKSTHVSFQTLISIEISNQENMMADQSKNGEILLPTV